TEQVTSRRLVAGAGRWVVTPPPEPEGAKRVRLVIGQQQPDRRVEQQLHERWTPWGERLSARGNAGGASRGRGPAPRACLRFLRAAPRGRIRRRVRRPQAGRAPVARRRARTPPPADRFPGPSPAARVPAEAARPAAGPRSPARSVPPPPPPPSRR